MQGTEEANVRLSGKKVGPGSTFAATQRKAIQPIRYMQVHIRGGLFCHVKSGILQFTCQLSRRKMK